MDNPPTFSPIDSIKRGSRFIDITGSRIGRLVVLRLSDFRKDKHIYWHCQCDCGNTKDIASTSLLGKATRSCGCLVFENHSNLQHGQTATREWRAWQDMKRRCRNPKRSDFKWYGGRGITVCDKWKSSFPAFLEDMGECPVGKTLGRIDNRFNYGPENCRWETPTEQANNRRTNRLLTFRGITKTAAQWSRDTGIKYQRIIDRLHSGWTEEEALHDAV